MFIQVLFSSTQIMQFWPRVIACGVEWCFLRPDDMMSVCVWREKGSLASRAERLLES